MVTAMNLRAGLILLGLVASALAGCGDQHSAATSSPSMLPATTPDVTRAESSVGVTGKEAPGTTEPEAITELVGFSSPSGNVGCILSSNYARCDTPSVTGLPQPGLPTASSTTGRASR
jgi:hypothetical protein